MTENPTGARRVRAGDADRDRAVAALQQHHQAGRLTAEEFEERMGAALAATWLDELPPLLADLPVGTTRDTSTASTASTDGRADEHRPGPPWPAWGPPGRRAPWLPIPGLLLALVLVGSVAAVAHGHIPFPLLWLALVAVWWRPWRLRRSWSSRGRR